MPLVRVFRTVYCRGGEGGGMGQSLGFYGRLVFGLYEDVEDCVREYDLRVV